MSQNTRRCREHGMFGWGQIALAWLFSFSICIWKCSERVNQSHTQFSCSFMSNCLQPHGLQHARLLYPYLSLGACSNSCPLIESVSSSHPILCHPFLLPSVFPSIRVFSNESVLHIRWPKYWSSILNYSSTRRQNIDFILAPLSQPSLGPKEDHSGSPS